MIATTWDELRTTRGSEAGVLRIRILPEFPIAVYAGMRKPKNMPLLIVEGPTEALPHGFTVPDVRGFSVSLRPVKPGPRGSVAVELELADESGQAVFLAMVEDLLQRIEPAATERAAFGELSQAIKRWTAFFREHGMHGLSRERQQGLYGELLFMRERLASSASAALAVSSWVGPTGANQDFEFAGHAFEVKTTSKNPVVAVRVSNLRQLDARWVESLRLIVVEVERHENAENTLPQAVEAVRTLVLSEAPDQAFRLADHLIEYGYLDQHAQMYSHTGYGVRTMRCFEVRNGFPVLIEDNMPNGVGDVTYSIDLPAIAEYEITDDQMRAELEDWFRDVG